MTSSGNKSWDATARGPDAGLGVGAGSAHSQRAAPGRLAPTRTGTTTPGRSRRPSGGTISAPARALGLKFDDATWSPAHQETAAADEAGAADPYGLEMIDPGEFDLYDRASDAAGQTADENNDSVEIRLDLAWMYMEMDDTQAAHELLADVASPGDEAQRRAAVELRERLGGER